MQDINSKSGSKYTFEVNQHKVLKYLSEMFGCLPSNELLKVCVENEWDVERCTDILISRGVSNNLRTTAGAVPKQNIPNSIQSLQKQFNNLDMNNLIKSPKLQNNPPKIQSDEERIVQQIKEGSKIMIIMRGAPGSGKSSLAEQLLAESIKLDGQYSVRDFIFTTDDYFYDSSGRYKREVYKLSEAHEHNQTLVRERALRGWSPIFVDNTNTQLWEMLPYVQIAVQNGYLIELLEPKTPWRNSPRKLAAKNKHGVQADKIQLMLDRFEKGSAADLLGMLKETKYKVELPQMRKYPPIFVPQDKETEEVFQICGGPTYDENTLQTVHLEDIASCETARAISDPIASKTQRQPVPLKSNPWAIEKEAVNNNEQEVVVQKQIQSWQPHEKEMASFWNKINNNINQPQKCEYEKKCQNNFVQETVSGATEQSKKRKCEGDLKKQKTFKRHSVNCPNENGMFSTLRQIYPNKHICGLWDLFVKCNGDVDWVVDILLGDDDFISKQNNQNLLSHDEHLDDFECDCATLEADSVLSVKSAIQPGVKPQRQRVRSTRTNQRANPDLQGIADKIASRFVLSEENYSPHIKKLREKHGSHTTKIYKNAEVQTDLPFEDTEEEETEPNEFVELKFGSDLLIQLKTLFQEETTLLNDVPDNKVIKAFVPRSLAKELFMFYLESVYNHIEEERQQTLREDENFAQLLKHPKYENLAESPTNVQELLDLEIALKLDMGEVLGQQNRPLSLAAHLTELKLCEAFPDIPRETLIQFFKANNNNYNETVKVLSDAPDTSILQNDLQNSTQDSVDNEKGPQQKNLRKPPLQPEEAKRLALREFEEMRNLAAHHSQLKAECYQKAKEAIQGGNSGVAVYYSQIASLHKMKLETYNHRAANSIMDVHRYTQNNPELLDLHYLHVLEAISCLDLFLDRHITWLRSASRSYKYVFIITGRGLHSAGGVSTIKTKVKSRLKERNLRWSEANPGLLKVKIFSASRHSKNI